MRNILLGLSLAATCASQLDAQENSGWPEDWYVLDTTHIDGDRGRDSALDHTSSGKRTDAIAFKAIDGDLSCERISVSFASGYSRWVELNPGNVLKQGTFYPVDLTEDDKITRINFTCNAAAGARVTMEIGAKG